MGGQAPAPSQPSTDDTPADPAGNDNGGDAKKDAKPESKPDNAPKVDAETLKSLPTDQLEAVLENPNLFKTGRISELLQAKKERDEMKAAQSQSEDERLKKEKKFEDLAAKAQKERDEANEKLQKATIDNAVTAKLVEAGTVDVQGALQLLDRSKVEVKDDGTVAGVDDAVEALKSDKSYLFNAGSSPQQVGKPTNPGQGGTQQPQSGQFRFKRSQLTPSFIKENQKEVDEAARLGQIEDDGPAPIQ